MSARETALRVLVACRKEGAWSNSVLKDYTQQQKLDRRDAALAARLCYGVLQNRLLLDFYLKQFLTGKLRDLHPVVRDILHLGLYQLYLMDKIPESAAVNESVTLAKKFCRGNRNAPGLVNAVLRNAQRNAQSRKEPVNLSERYSHPQQLLDLLAESIGKARIEPMLQANNAAVPTVVQVNTLRITTDALQQRLQEEGVQVQHHDWLPDCLILTATGNLEDLASFREGLFYVQDAAAKLSVLCAQLPQKDDLQVLDCCAAPGGKSFAAAITTNGKAQLHSCDIHPHKTTLIQNGARRLGIEKLQTLCHDATQDVPDWHGKMDVVIADVPCSGYGIIRKKPDIRYKDPASMAELPLLQEQILHRQAKYVKPGGVLLYSTCTLLKRENQDVVNAFLKTEPTFYLESLPLPSPLKEDSLGMLTLVPGEYDTDGFFICRLRRK